jgi:cytochrome c oxidase subunit II
MRKFAIEPNVIHVKEGENVVLDVSSGDVQHGFQVEQLGINESVQPGRPIAIALNTARKGQFTIRKGQFTMQCSIICGAGHDNMTGKIVVE